MEFLIGNILKGLEAEGESPKDLNQSGERNEETMEGRCENY